MNTSTTTLRRVILCLCWVGIILSPTAVFPQMAEDPAGLVNPFVGTATSSLHDNGYTTPGAVRPFGLLYWSPDTPDIVNYHYDDPVTYGFSLTHISGPGCGLYGDVPIFPMLGAPEKSPVVMPSAYKAGFSHTSERAEPGYYEVRLDSGIEVRLAAQMRSGIAEFRFPPGRIGHTLLIDLGRNLSPRVEEADIQIRDRTITGSVTSGETCNFLPNHYQVYFAIETAEVPEAYGTFDETGLVAGSGAARGPHSGGYATFGASVQTVRIKVGVSFVSVANAEENLRREIGDWDLNGVRQDARTAWNRALGQVKVSGGTDEDRKVFYTALYHSLIHPSVFSDVDGEYIGFDGKVHTAGRRIQYANFSGWDIYRSQVQLLAMLFPDRASDMAESLVVDAEQGGGLPIWVAANDDSCAMVGDPSACILAGMYAFGARGFNAKAALAAMLRGANDPRVHSRHCVERPHLAEYLRQGYVPEQGKDGAASVTLEYQNADFAISQLAAALGDEMSAQDFLFRSAQWRKLFDPETRYIRPRGPDGRFLPGFTPGSDTGFVEGNAAQYTWMIPYDLAGVIAAIGGPEAVRERLDNYFSEYYDWTKKNGPYVFISNEPSFGDPWVYNWSGQPWRTQEVVRKVIRDLFSTQPGGLPGNDDLGAMSSWLVFAQLGLYPEIPGLGGVTLHSPIFPEVTLRLGQHELRITAAGAPSKPYVHRVDLDDQPVRNWWIEWEHLAKASKLDFKLNAEPNHDPGSPPPSFAPTER